MFQRVKSILVQFILVGTLISVVIIAVITLLFPLDNRGAEAPEFERRRAQWESLHITHYRAKIRSGGLEWCYANVEVQDNQLIDYQRIDFEGTPIDAKLFFRIVSSN
jgi:hypothetical protein